MSKRTLYLISLLLPFLFTSPVFADDDGGAPCPVASPYKDASGNPVSFEQMFGDDVVSKMRCNKRRSKVKLVMQVNAFLDSKNRPYGFRNLPNVIKDFKITHAVKKHKIAVIVHSGGYPAILDPDAAVPHPDAHLNAQAPGPFTPVFPTVAHMVKGLMAQGVEIYFCLNTGAAKQIKTHQVLPGVKFVPAGVSSLVDFQYKGYKYVQP